MESHLMNPTWTKYFMQMAALAASKSKDRSTQVGAVVVGPDNDLRASGYNGYPRLVTDDHDGSHDRETRLLHTIHAEANSIAAAARAGTSTKGCRMYVTHWPCADCSKLIIQAGICEVIAPKPTDEFYERWKDSMDAGLAMFREAGVVARAYEEVTE